MTRFLSASGLKLVGRTEDWWFRSPGTLASGPGFWETRVLSASRSLQLLYQQHLSPRRAQRVGRENTWARVCFAETPGADSPKNTKHQRGVPTRSPLCRARGLLKLSATQRADGSGRSAPAGGPALRLRKRRGSVS